MRMSRFQLIFTGLLVFAAVAGAVLFAVVRSDGNQGAVKLTMWGTLPADAVNRYLSAVALANRDTVDVSYSAKDAATFESDLIAALARGQGPDMALLPHDLIVKQLDKFYVIPFENYPERSFKDAFVEGAEIYLAQNGVIAMPLSIDPIVMYWNRDIFSNAGVSLPPTTWTELYSLAPKMAAKDSAGNITQSLIAFGATGNVARYKEVISLLALQAGTPIVAMSETGYLRSVFSSTGQGLVPGEQAVNFYTEFSDPVRPHYSWNGSLQGDRSAFVAGKLALYFGYASELSSIRAANPNLNFDVAAVPQASGRKATFARMNGIALLKSSPNLAASFRAAAALTGSEGQSSWVAASNYPPIRRDLLAKRPAAAHQAVFYDSALIARAWLDPDAAKTSDIFARLVQNVTSGRMRTSEAVRSASVEIDSLLR